MREQWDFPTEKKLKKKHVEILELKSTYVKFKNSPDGINIHYKS